MTEAHPAYRPLAFDPKDALLLETRTQQLQQITNAFALNALPADGEAAIMRLLKAYFAESVVRTYALPARWVDSRKLPRL